MRKHHSSTTALMGLVTKKAEALLDARIDAAVVEFTEIMMDWEHVDFRDLEQRLTEAKQGGFPPPPRWRQDAKTVDDVPDAQGSFSFLTAPRG